MDEMGFDFERDGFTVIRGAFDAAGVADVLWGVLSRRFGVLPEDPSTWRPGTFGKLTKFGKAGRFAAVGTDTVRDAVSAVFGCDWHERERWGQPLITFPDVSTWTVPHGGWHIDLPPSSPLPAVRMFAYLSEVAAGGGATVVVRGSHRLVSDQRGKASAALRGGLADRSDWFRELWRPIAGGDRVQRFMHDGATVDGVDVQVVELTGHPGDVVLWHPALLHAAAPNSSNQPRFMLTHTAQRGPGNVHGRADMSREGTR